MWITGGNQPVRRENEKVLLCRLLNEAGLVYSVTPDLILIPFRSDGSEFIEDGAEINLVAFWTDGWITIALNLIELEENEQGALDSAFLAALMKANYMMNICKFGFSSYGLSLLVDFDSRNLQHEEIESGISSLLNGLEVYLSILYEWLNYVRQTLNLNLQGLNEAQVTEHIKYLQEVDLQEAQRRGDKETGIKGLIVRSLTGFAKVAGTVAIGGIIATGLGIPAEAMMPFLLALAGGETDSD